MQMHSGLPIRLATETFDASGRGRQRAAATSLEIRVFGEFTVLLDGAPLLLPRSRTARQSDMTAHPARALRLAGLRQ
jgi:hypothetical protein